MDESQPERWESKAACRDYTPELDWFTSDRSEKYDARAICRSKCPVRRECIETALNEKRIHGIWGGVDDYEIRRTLSVDAYGEPSTRTRSPRCPYCLGRKLDISGVKSRQGYRTECLKCGLTWHMATIPAKLRTKRTAR